jgi:hypothetical protein
MIKDLFFGSVATAPGTAFTELTSGHHDHIDNVTDASARRQLSSTPDASSVQKAIEAVRPSIRRGVA